MSSRNSTHESAGERIECIVTYSKGFICSGGSGTLHLFEKTENKYLYKKSRSVTVWVDPSSSLVTHTPTTGADSPGGDNDILSMTLSPSEETVVCTTRTQQLYNLTLSAADLQGKVEKNRLPSNPATLGTNHSVLIRGVPSFSGVNFKSQGDLILGVPTIACFYLQSLF